MADNDTGNVRDLVVRGPEPTTELPTGQVILFEQFRLFRRSWIFVLALALLVTAAVGVYVFQYMPVQFLATVRALPPNKSSTPLDNLVGGISSSLKDFGLSKLVGKSGGDAGYSKSVLITSQPLYDSLIIKYDLYKVYDIPKDRYDRIYKKMAENIVVDISPDGPISVDVYDEKPERAAKMANDVIYFTNVLARDINRLESEPLTRYVGQRYDSVRRDQQRIGLELQKFMASSKLFDPETQGKVISSAVMEAEVDVAAKRQVLDGLRSVLGADDPRTVQAETQLKLAQDASRRLAAGRPGVLEGLSLEKLPASTIEYLRLKQDYEVNAKVLALMEPMYEQSRYDEMRDIPILNILDPARAPFEKARPKRSVIIASTFVGTFLVCYVIIAILAYLRSFLARYRRYDEITTGKGTAGALKQ